MRFAAAALALALAACNPAADTGDASPQEQQIPIDAPSGDYTLDPHHTTVTVRARHFGLASYTLRFNRVAGTLDFNAEDPVQSSIEASVDVTSLDTPFSGERDFDAELQNSQWLDSANHAVATFASTAVERTGPNTGRVTGDLTIRGVTRPITMDVTYNASWARHPLGHAFSGIGFSARGTIRRSEYGLTVLQPQPGAPNTGVADEVELLIEAEFTRPVEQDVPSREPAEPVN